MRLSSLRDRSRSQRTPYRKLAGLPSKETQALRTAWAMHSAKGEGVPQDDAESARWYSKAAELGHAEAQRSLGVQYLCGRGVPGDWAKAAKWFGRAAEQGHAEAQYSLGFTYHHSEGFQNHEYTVFFRAPTAEAVRWYRKAADQGHTDAQYELGRAYYYGQGVPQDYAEAAKWYRRGAEQGHAEALGELGHAYYNGKGVPKDYAEGAKLCWKAALQEGVNGDRYNIAYYCYHNVTRDYAEGLKWYLELAEQGDFEALEFLADFFPLAYREAVSKAAERGHAYWQYELGQAYYRGREFPRRYEGQGFPQAMLKLQNGCAGLPSKAMSTLNTTSAMHTIRARESPRTAARR